MRLWCLASLALVAPARSLAPVDRRTLGAAVCGTGAASVGGAASAKAPPVPEVVTDRRGVPIFAGAYEAARAAGAPAELVAGVAGEPTFLLLDDDGKLRDYALKAECTHLGCLVGPLNPISRRYVCPCHGSEYAADGAVLRGPAPKPLVLARVSTDDAGHILLEPWQGPDFR